MGRGTWQATVHGVTKSRTRLSGPTQQWGSIEEQAINSGWRRVRRVFTEEMALKLDIQEWVRWVHMEYKGSK